MIYRIIFISIFLPLMAITIFTEMPKVLKPITYPVVIDGNKELFNERVTTNYFIRPAFIVDGSAALPNSLYGIALSFLPFCLALVNYDLIEHFEDDPDTVALHEYIHCIGYGHHHNKDDIMHPYINSRTQLDSADGYLRSEDD